MPAPRRSNAQDAEDGNRGRMKVLPHYMYTQDVISAIDGKRRDEAEQQREAEKAKREQERKEKGWSKPRAKAERAFNVKNKR